MGILVLFLFFCVCIGVDPKVWHVGFAPGQYGQVDSVGLNINASRVFASLLDRETSGFDLRTGAGEWARDEVGTFAVNAVSREGDTVCIFDATTSPSFTLYLTCYSTFSSSLLLFQRTFPNSQSQNIAISRDGKTLAIGVNTLVNKTWNSTVYILDGTRGTILNAFSCFVGSQEKGIINALLALDPTGTTVAYSCFPANEPQTAVINVRDTRSKSSTPLLQVTGLPASGTGFALSHNGDYFSFGVTQTHVYKRNAAKTGYSLLFTRNPVSDEFPRLLEAIAFDSEQPDPKGGPYLATGYYVADTVSKSQQSFVEVFDLGSATPSTPAWSYKFANSTSQFQDSIGDLFFCGRKDNRVLSIASWGVPFDQDPNVATVHAFVAETGAPLMQYTTPGSMFSVQCWIEESANEVWVTAGGKREHANIMGSGGDLYALKVAV